MSERKVANANRGFKGIWIPANYWLDENLSIQEMLFLAEIDSLDVDEKGCYATNKHFSDFFGLTPSRCSQIITSLKEKGYVVVELVFNSKKEIKKRTIRVVNKLNTPIKYSKGGYLENCASSNTSFSNTKDNMSSLDKTPYKKIIEYLNKKAESRFSYKSADSQKHIKARWNEGNDLEMFLEVINLKTNEWKDNPQMSQYLRPSTLFSAKNFENYKGQVMAEKRKKNNTQSKTNDIDVNELGKLFSDAQ